MAWRAASLRAARPRVVYLKSVRPAVAIYTDAATSAATLAAAVVDAASFAGAPCFEAAIAEKADEVWLDTFSETNLIYGLEMLAVVATMLS